MGHGASFDVTTFPRAVRVIEHTLIPLKDGTTLAARIWLPDDAERNPVPAILEYLPYRKRDGTYERDALTHPAGLSHTGRSLRSEIALEDLAPGSRRSSTLGLRSGRTRGLARDPHARCNAERAGRCHALGAPLQLAVWRDPSGVEVDYCRFIMH